MGDDLRIARAREVAALLAEARAAGAVEIDASQVERVDAAGLQALVAGVARLREAKVAVRWGGVAPALSTSAAIAGLAGVLELP